MSFEALLNDLDALQKARLPVASDDSKSDDSKSDDSKSDDSKSDDSKRASDKKSPSKKDSGDRKIVSAADGDVDSDGKSDGTDDLPEEDDADNEESDDEESDDEDEDEGKAKKFGKSFTVMDPSGKPFKVYDGMEMMKAFHRRIAALEQDVAARQTEAQQATAVMRKQTELLKSMSQQLAALSESGRGRKSVLTIHDKPSAVPSASDRPAPQAVLAKAISAQKSGKITGIDVARIESYLSRGLEIPAELADFCH